VKDVVDSNSENSKEVGVKTVLRNSPPSRIPSRKSSQPANGGGGGGGGGEAATLSEDLRRLEFRLERYMSKVSTFVKKGTVPSIRVHVFFRK
jgi:hypothetical protein